MDCHSVEELFDAYVDRELAPADASSVRDHLAGCPDCARRVTEREALGRLVRLAPYYTAPAALRTRIAQTAPRSRSIPRRFVWAAAAAVLVAALGGSAAFVQWSRRPGPVDTIAVAVVDSHVRALMGEHLFDVRSSDQHTVKPWFLGKIDFAPPVVDLAARGFPLTGGRLDYITGNPAAALVYRRSQHTINVFIWPESAAGPGVPDARSIRGFHVRHWIRAGMSFWAVSDLNDAELDEFVRLLRQS